MIFFESAGGSDGCQPLWKGLTGAKARFSLPCLTTTCLRTIWFVQLMLSLKVLILASLALGRVDKLNPDSDAGKQHEGGEALDQLVVAGGDTA